MLPGTEDLTAEADWFPDRFVPHRGWPDAQDRPHEEISQGKSDAAGEVAIARPVSGGALFLHVSGEGHRPALVGDIPGGDSIVEVVVSRGGRLRGTLRRPDLGPLRVVLRADPVGELAGEAQWVPIEPDGGFDVAGWPVGTYDLVVFVANRYHYGGGSSGTVRRIEPPLARIELREGEVTEAALDASHLASASVRGRAILDGEPIADARVVLAAVDGGGANYGQFVPDATGRFEASHVMPGRYRARLIVGDFEVSSGDWIDADVPFEVVVGDEVERELHFVRRSLRAKLLEVDTRQPITLAGWLQHQSGRAHETFNGDAEGWILIDPIPVGEYVVRVGGYRPSASFSITVADKDKEIVLELKKLDGGK